MQDAEFNQIVNDLLDGTPPRVWSLLVTMFGDLAVAPEARLSGTTVNALTATIGIKPEATRVALHRLRKEDWIDSHRIGRQSRYGLTDKGRAETNAAWCRVYGPDPAHMQVFLVTEDPAAPADAPTKTAVSLSPRLWMSDSAPEASSHWAIPLPLASPVPRWVSEKLCPPEVQAASQTLNRRFTMLCEDTDFMRLTLLQATALRMLVVHEWRRLILRVPAFPEALFSDGWHGSACRAHLSGMLANLPVPNLADLHHAIDADHV